MATIPARGGWVVGPIGLEFTLPFREIATTKDVSARARGLVLRPAIKPRDYDPG